MNSAANMRAAFIRGSMFTIPVGYGSECGPKRGPMDNYTSRQGESRGPADPDNISSEERRRVKETLSYLEYQTLRKIEWEEKAAAAAAATSSSTFNRHGADEVKQPVIETNTAASAKLKRMCTVFPCRDMNWVVSVMFVIGSISFVINACFGMLPVYAPDLVFDTLNQVALPTTILIGATFFLSAGTLGIFAGFNADRGTVELADEKQAVGVPDVYRPALIGSPSWVWFPGRADIAASLSTTPLQACLIQMSGGVILTTAAVAGIPGVIDQGKNLPLFKILVFWPQVIGGSLFFIANMLLLTSLSERWYKPNFFSADWQGAFWNAVGSSGFLLTGVFLLGPEAKGAAWATFYGSSAFLYGSLVQWYALMEFHPTAWAG